MTWPESSFRLPARWCYDFKQNAKCYILLLGWLKVILCMSNFCECECNFTNQDQIKHFSCTTSCNSMFIMLVSYTSTLPAAASKLEGWRNREWVRPAPSIHEVWQTPCYLTLAPREFSNNFRSVITATKWNRITYISWKNPEYPQKNTKSQGSIPNSAKFLVFIPFFCFIKPENNFQIQPPTTKPLSFELIQGSLSQRTIQPQKLLAKSQQQKKTWGKNGFGCFQK